jgi:site-specific DNA-methyltransferase (adenine-specific)
MNTNYLYYGDNLDILTRYLKDETVDLIYLDPPFNSSQDYNVLFAEKDGSQSTAQIKAFKDTWQWDQQTALTYQDVVERDGRISQALQAFRKLLGNNDMLAYLVMMAARLVELHRVLKATGSLWLHCDPTASHYLKIMLDAIFDAHNYRNEIIWHYGQRTAFHKGHFSRKHDSIFFYTKSQQMTLNAVSIPWTKEEFIAHRHDVKSDEEGQEIIWTDGGKSGVRYKRLVEDVLKEGKPLDSVWDIPLLNSSAKERLGYPTQKPEILLERIIKAASNEGDVVLDPFCGCGTTIAVAQRLQRNWIGIDITSIAINLIKTRLLSAYGENITQNYIVRGEPTTYSEAKALADLDKYQFQWWALGLVGARPVEEKKGADKGIDGRLYFHDEGDKTKQVIFSIKGGHTSVKDVRDLRGVIDREDAEIGVLISLQQPTNPMIKETTSAGFYHSPWGKHPRLQLLTITQLVEEGKHVDMPPLRQVNITFKKSPRVKEQKLGTLLLPFDQE